MEKEISYRRRTKKVSPYQQWSGIAFDRTVADADPIRDDSAYAGSRPTKVVQNQRPSAVDHISPTTFNQRPSSDSPDGAEHNPRSKSLRRRFIARWKRTWAIFSRSRGRKQYGTIPISIPADAAIDSTTRSNERSRSRSPSKDPPHPHPDDVGHFHKSHHRSSYKKSTVERCRRSKNDVPRWERDVENPDPTTDEKHESVEKWMQDVHIHPSISSKLKQPVQPSRPRALEQSRLLDGSVISLYVVCYKDKGTYSLI